MPLLPSAQQILDALPDAVLVLSEDGRVLYANREAEALFGYAAGELVDQPVQKLFVADKQLSDTSSRTPWVADLQIFPCTDGQTRSARTLDKGKKVLFVTAAIDGAPQSKDPVVLPSNPSCGRRS